MNNRFSILPSHYHERSPFFPNPGDPTVGTLQQGDFGYSDPRRYRCSELDHSQSLPSCCPRPFLGQSPPFGISPYNTQSPLRGSITHRYFKHQFQPALPEHTPNFVRKDSYWSSLPSTTISGVRQKVAKIFVDHRAERRKVKRLALRERPFTMSSSTALLPKNPDQRRGDQHVGVPANRRPIFLTVASRSFFVSVTLHGSSSARKYWSSSAV